MKPQKIQFTYDLPIWLGRFEMEILFGCKKTIAYEIINTIRELIRDKHPSIYKVKGKILTQHLILSNDFPISKEDIVKSLKERISLVDIHAMKIHSALSA